MLSINVFCSLKLRGLPLKRTKNNFIKICFKYVEIILNK